MLNFRPSEMRMGNSVNSSNFRETLGSLSYFSLSVFLYITASAFYGDAQSPFERATHKVQLARVF